MTPVASPDTTLELAFVLPVPPARPTAQTLWFPLKMREWLFLHTKRVDGEPVNRRDFQQLDAEQLQALIEGLYE